MAARLGFLSTYPPTQCGIATFCDALASQLVADGAEVGVVRLVDTPHVVRPPVVMQWATDRAVDAAQAAATLDTYDVAVIQHEYGIFGGADGMDVIEVAARLHVPVVTVLHTVLTTPTPQPAPGARLAARLLRRRGDHDHHRPRPPDRRVGRRPGAGLRDPARRAGQPFAGGPGPRSVPSAARRPGVRSS